MKNASQRNSGVPRFRMRPAVRILIAALLVGTLGLEILPWGYVECVPAAPGEKSGRAFRIEPLQVCDHGDTFLGVLFDLPVLLPGAPCLYPSPELARLFPEPAAFAPDGFLPAIDHPPQLPSQL